MKSHFLGLTKIVSPLTLFSPNNVAQKKAVAYATASHTQQLFTFLKTDIFYIHTP